MLIVCGCLKRSFAYRNHTQRCALGNSPVLCTDCSFAISNASLSLPPQCTSLSLPRSRTLFSNLQFSAYNRALSTWKSLRLTKPSRGSLSSTFRDVLSLLAVGFWKVSLLEPGSNGCRRPSWSFRLWAFFVFSFDAMLIGLKWRSWKTKGMELVYGMSWGMQVGIWLQL